ESFPIDAHEPEPAELRELQTAYRRRLQSDTHVFHPLTSSEALEASVLKLRDDLTRLRRGVKQWAVGVIALLVFVLAASLWLVQAQRRQGKAIQNQSEKVTTIIDRYQKMEQALARLAEVESRPKVPGEKLNPEEQRARAYGILERELGLAMGTLAKELPAFAVQLYNRGDTSPVMRARAAYALGKFDEAEKLSVEGALQDRRAYESAQHVAEDRRKQAIESYELAGWSAEKRIQYAAALEHFREAEKLTDRDRDAGEWARVQQTIGVLLTDQGKYREATEKLHPSAAVAAAKVGPESALTLKIRNDLAVAMMYNGNWAAAEEQFSDILRLRETALG